MSEYSPHTADAETVADDRLNGAAEIAAFTGDEVWKIYYLFGQGRLAGVWKDGNLLKGSKAAIRRAHHNKARAGK